MTRARVAVLVSGGGTNLQAIIDQVESGRLPHAQLALVISNKEGAFALERARRAGIETATVLRSQCADAADFEDRIVALIEQHGCELIVLAGFMSILSERFTSRFPRRILNVHPSLIPSFCGKGYYGLRVHEAALSYGVKVTGATVHFVNEIPDGGEILLQKAVRIRKGDTPEKLQKRVMQEAEWKILPRAVELVCREICAKK